MDWIKKIGTTSALGGTVLGAAGFGLFLAAELANGKATAVLLGNDKAEARNYAQKRGEEIELLRQQRLESVKILSRDGLTLKGRILRAKQKNDRVVLAVHGYKSTGLQEYRKIAWMYQEMGYDVLMVDNRAHGSSEGPFIGFGCLDREDVYQWIRFLVKRYGEDAEIILHGVSMGAATVLMTLDLNLPAGVRAVVADCGYTSVKEQMSYLVREKFHVPPFPIVNCAELFSRYLAGYDYHSISPMGTLSQAKIPVLFIHGSEDDFVPTWMGKANYAACASELKELYLVPGAAHAKSFPTDPEGYKKRVRAFLAKAASYEHRKRINKE